MMYHHYVDQDCVVFNPPLQFGTAIYMILKLHHIFVVFLIVRLVLDSDSLEQKLPEQFIPLNAWCF